MVFGLQKLLQKGEKVSLIRRISQPQEGLLFRFAEFGFGFGGCDLQKKQIAKVAGEILCNSNGVAVAGAKLNQFGQCGGAIPS